MGRSALGRAVGLEVKGVKERPGPQRMRAWRPGDGGKVACGILLVNFFCLAGYVAFSRLNSDVGCPPINWMERWREEFQVVVRTWCNSLPLACFTHSQRDFLEGGGRAGASSKLSRMLGHVKTAASSSISSCCGGVFYRWMYGFDIGYATYLDDSRSGKLLCVHF